MRAGGGREPPSSSSSAAALAVALRVLLIATACGLVFALLNLPDVPGERALLAQPSLATPATAH